MSTYNVETAKIAVVDKMKQYEKHSQGKTDN